MCEGDLVESSPCEAKPCRKYQIARTSGTITRQLACDSYSGLFSRLNECKDIPFQICRSLVSRISSCSLLARFPLKVMLSLQPPL